MLIRINPQLRSANNWTLSRARENLKRRERRFKMIMSRRRLTPKKALNLPELIVKPTGRKITGTRARKRRRLMVKQETQLMTT
jgi:hypothetical protein